MNETERQLLEGLRALAAMEPREASPRVERTLRATFRARAERRRRAVWGSAAAAFVAIAAAIMVLFFARFRGIGIRQRHGSPASFPPTRATCLPFSML